jgi:hypothetical protein
LLLLLLLLWVQALPGPQRLLLLLLAMHLTNLHGLLLLLLLSAWTIQLLSAWTIQLHELYHNCPALCRMVNSTISTTHL